MIDDYVLKAKHWQIFFTLSAPYLIFGFMPSFNGLRSQIQDIFSIAYYFSWLLILGRNLNSFIPFKDQLDDVIFIFNNFYVVTSYVIIRMSLLSEIKIFLHGWSFLPYMYFFIAYFQIHNFLAKALTSAEQQRRTSFSEHRTETLGYLLFFVGILYFQNRVNSMYNKKIEKIQN
jgi:hypothetical protein